MSRESICYTIALVVGAWIAAACQGQTREQSRAMFIFMAYAAMSEVAPAPAPSPTPTPVSDICENCNGRGKVGDGTVMVTCPECDGTGKRKKVSAPATIRKQTVTHGYSLSDGPSDYRPRWTWPGDLRLHLRQSPHNIETGSWTQDQREMYHDQWHDRYGSR